MSNYFVLQLKRMRSCWLRPVLVCRCIAQQPGGTRCYKHSATCWQMPTESCLCNALCWLWMIHLPAWHSLVPPPIEAKAKLSQNSILPLIEISLKCFNGNPFLFEHATKLVVDWPAALGLHSILLFPQKHCKFTQGQDQAINDFE